MDLFRRRLFQRRAAPDDAAEGHVRVGTRVGGAARSAQRLRAVASANGRRRERRAASYRASIGSWRHRSAERRFSHRGWADDPQWSAACPGARRERPRCGRAPMSVMNSRRLIVAPRGQNHAPHRLTAVWVLEWGKGDANCDQLFWSGNVGSGSHDRGKTGKAQNQQMLSGLPPKSDIRFARQRGTNYLSIGFAKRLRGHGPQQGATLGADHLVWGAPRRNFHAADAATRTRVRARGLPESLGERG